MLSTRHIAQRLSDLPRWVEPRDLLFTGECNVFGLREEPGLSVVLRDADGEAVFVIGAPAVAV
jgi:hypothetical protein